MSRWNFLVAAFVLTAFVSAIMAQSQGTTNPRALVGNIRGHVLQPDGAPLAQAVRIGLTNATGDTQVIYTDYLGQFDFKRLPIGIYQIEADPGPERYEIASQSVQVFKDATIVANLTLKERKAKGPAGTTGPRAVVSAGELDENIPKEARKEFERASKAAAESKTEESITHLRKAVAIYPDFMMAHNDLGAQLLQAERFDEAAIELNAAVKLDPKAFNPRFNLGLVLIKQRQYAAAAQVLDEAISLDPQAPGARLYAGVARLELKDLDRAEKELRLAYESGGSDYALALFYLGGIYIGRGDRPRALQSFEAYLREMPGAPNAEQVKKMIEKLR